MTPGAPVSSTAAEMLLATARSTLTDDDVRRVRGAVRAIEDWDALVAAALRHGTAGLLCHHLLAAGRDLIPDAIADAAETYIAYRHAEYARTAGDLGAVLDVLRDAGVRALPYKGLVLAALCHAVPMLRECRDLDVLIHERDIAATMAALERLGYRSLQTGLSPRRMRAFHAYNGQGALVCDDRIPVEPHWRLNPRTLRAEIGVADLFARSGASRWRVGRFRLRHTKTRC
jgi:hypothetical protein